MDIYGAFQFCALGILSTPFSFRFSSTNLNLQDRQILFLWTDLIFAGSHVSVLIHIKSLIPRYRLFMFDCGVLP